MRAPEADPGPGRLAGGDVAGVFLFVVPALVDALLCSIWALKLVQTALGVWR